jgi:3-deoxy-D-manno-octulosonic-acid transferase
VDELLDDEQAPLRVVVSATTDTGFDRARELYADRLEVVRFPLDFSASVSRFLDGLHPDAVVLMELELWPNLCATAEDRGIPLIVVNGRLSKSSFRNYRLARPLVRSTFARVGMAAVQTETYARRFEALGVPRQRIRVTDNMKWDTALLADEIEGSAELARELGIDPDRPLVVAGSTGPGEEAILLDRCPDDVQLLLAPRRPERFDEVAALDPGFVRRSGGGPRTEAGGGRPSRFLLDTIGELRKAYALADVVIIGRSFAFVGGSDPIEAVALGRPTVIGPHYEHFAAVVEALLEGDGIRVAEDPMAEAVALLSDPDAAALLGANGRAVIRAHRGASRENARLIRQVVAERRSTMAESEVADE